MSPVLPCTHGSARPSHRPQTVDGGWTWRQQNASAHTSRTPPARTENGEACEVDGCDRTAKARRLYTMHDDRWYRSGTPDGVVPGDWQAPRLTVPGGTSTHPRTRSSLPPTDGGAADSAGEASRDRPLDRLSARCSAGGRRERPPRAQGPRVQQSGLACRRGAVPRCVRRRIHLAPPGTRRRPGSALGVPALPRFRLGTLRCTAGVTQVRPGRG